MTLSALPIDKRAGKIAAVYGGVSAFCLIFGLVYEYFSHGVYSGFMVYLFAIPFVLGALPFATAAILHLRLPGRLSMNAYGAGVAALTVASCLRGVFDIYGTASPHVIFYWIAGGILTAAGIILYAMKK